MRLLAVTTLAVILSPLANAQKTVQPTPELKTNRDKISYGIGLNIGQQFKSQGLDVDPKIVVAGIMTALSGAEPALTRAEIQQAFTALQAETAANNKAAAKKFLTENARKEGVKTTKTGMQYIVVAEGSGKTPGKDDSVSTHYRGTLIDGKVFDQSYEGEAPTAADEPASFGVGQVIPGWTEALQMMKVGARYRLFIPPELAYGENGPPGIGPNRLLIFDIQLLKVN